MTPTASLLLALAAVLATCQAQAGWMFGGDGANLFRTFQEGMKELEVASRRVSDLVGSESRTGEDSSREDLEELPETKAAGRDEDASVDKDSDETDDLAGADLTSVFGDIPDFFNIFRKSSSSPWWSGPNVCVNRETKEENSSDKEEKFGSSGMFILGTAQFSSCKHTTQKYICTTVTHTNGATKTSTVTYQCCHGFRRLSNKPGCSKVETKPILELATDLGATKYSSMVSTLRMEEKLEEGNTTAIMPTDEAFSGFQGTSSGNQIDQNKETNDINEVLQSSESQSKEIVLNHILPNLVETSDFQNDMLLKTEANTTLRINLFPGKNGPRMTVNCATFNVTDKQTDSGMVHTVNKVLVPVRRTVMDILSDPEYSQFAQLLKDNELFDELKGEGPFTVLALTNMAMNNLESKSMCMKRILKHHILPHTVCSEAAGDSRISAMDLSSHWVQMSRDEDGSLVLDGTVKVTRPDILATNGLVHEVESLVVPSSAKTLREVLKNHNRTLFLDLMDRTGVLADIEKAKDKVTLFIPTEASIKEVSSKLESMEPEALKEVVSYHVGLDPKGEDGCELQDGVITMDTKLDGKQITIKSYSKGSPPLQISQILSGLAGMNQVATAGCSRLTGSHGKVCNGAVREVAEVIFPPKGTLYEILQNNDDFKEFRDLLSGTKLEEELKSGLGKSVTLLIPTGEALKKMGDGNYDTLLRDKSLADQILRAHVLAEPVCCSGVGVSSWPFTTAFRTLSGGGVEADRRFTGKVTFGSVPVAKCDLLATDGIIHLLKGVMLPAGHGQNTDIIYRRPNSEIILTGF